MTNTKQSRTADLTDPSFWAGADAHDLLREMRRRSPVQLTESATEGPLWSVLSYAASAEVLGDAASFSSEHGSLLGTGPNKVPAGAGKMMALTDPPRHRTLRGLVLPFFSKKKAAQLRDRVGELTDGVVDRALARGDVDFVRDVSTFVPLTVMCELLGVPDEDRDDVVEMCDIAFLGDNQEQRTRGHQQLLPYLFNLALERRSAPRDDLMSTLATHTINGEQLPLDEILLNCDNILVGGIQTVRHTATMAMLTLMENPSARAQIARAEVDMDLAVEELLRWTSVGLHVLRTATADCTLAGSRIRRGDRVVVWAPSANRDEREFEAPDRLLLDRNPNRHMAFGWGPHYCIGAPLARIELELLFTSLARKVTDIEVTGPPVYNRSIINFGLESFPVRLSART